MCIRGWRSFFGFLGDAAACRDYLGAEPVTKDEVGVDGGLWFGAPLGP